MAHSFSLASLTEMEPIFDRHIRQMLVAIESYGNQPFDMKDVVGYYAYDLMGELAFHADFATQTSQDPSQLPPINDHIFLGCMYGMLPSLLPWSMRIGNYLPIQALQNLLKSRRSLKERTATHVAMELRKEKNLDQHSLLTRLIDAKDHRLERS